MDQFEQIFDMVVGIEKLFFNNREISDRFFSDVQAVYYDQLAVTDSVDRVLEAITAEQPVFENKAVQSIRLDRDDNDSQRASEHNAAKSGGADSVFAAVGDIAALLNRIAANVQALSTDKNRDAVAGVFSHADKTEQLGKRSEEQKSRTVNTVEGLPEMSAEVFQCAEKETAANADTIFKTTNGSRSEMSVLFGGDRNKNGQLCSGFDMQKKFTGLVDKDLSVVFSEKFFQEHQMPGRMQDAVLDLPADGADRADRTDAAADFAATAIFTDKTPLTEEVFCFSDVLIPAARAFSDCISVLQNKSETEEQLGMRMPPIADPVFDMQRLQNMDFLTDILRLFEQNQVADSSIHTETSNWFRTNKAVFISDREQLFDEDSAIYKNKSQCVADGTTDSNKTFFHTDAMFPDLFYEHTQDNAADAMTADHFETILQLLQISAREPQQTIVNNNVTVYSEASLSDEIDADAYAESLADNMLMKLMGSANRF